VVQVYINKLSSIAGPNHETASQNSRLVISISYVVAFIPQLLSRKTSGTAALLASRADFPRHLHFLLLKIEGLTSIPGSKIQTLSRIYS